MSRVADPVGDRGVSEVVGVVLLIGMVLAGAATLILAGTATKDDLREQNRMETTGVS